MNYCNLLIFVLISCRVVEMCCLYILFGVLVFLCELSVCVRCESICVIIVLCMVFVSCIR